MDLASIKDVTSYGKLVDYLNNDPSTSGLIVIKDESLDIVDVAECFVGSDHVNMVNMWAKSGQIIHLGKKNKGILKSEVMPFKMAVEVIRVVPFFILKSLKKYYE